MSIQLSVDPQYVENFSTFIKGVYFTKVLEDKNGGIKENFHYSFTSPKQIEAGAFIKNVFKEYSVEAKETHNLTREDKIINTFIRGDSFLSLIVVNTREDAAGINIHFYGFKEVWTGIFERLKDYEKQEKTKENNLPFHFTYFGKEGMGTTVKRTISTEPWKDIRQNYFGETKEKLDKLIHLVPENIYGKFIILHGKPGTGKTNFIKTLMKEWRTWAKANYIIDTEHLFTNSNYFFNTILDVPSFDFGDDDEEESPDSKKYKIIIMEDVDEFLSMEAKEKSGQMVSRLLNVSDGILGQGLNLLFVTTTNIPIEKFNEALTRPGRCLTNIEFNPASKEEAEAWLENKGVKEEIKERIPLSGLFEKISMKSINKSKEENERMGFRKK